jgi:hypothetical protein
MKRSHAISLGVSASALVATSLRSTALAHNLPANTFGSAGYDATLKANGGTKAVFQSANVESTVKQGDTLLSVQVKNWMNAFQFSYGIQARRRRDVRVRESADVRGRHLVEVQARREVQGHRSGNWGSFRSKFVLGEPVRQ